MFVAMNIDAALVSLLVHDQFPAWRELAVAPVVQGGWDNRSFRLGGDMLVRMPAAELYAAAVSKEQAWLPKLAPSLPLAIPEVLALGRPGEGYPWPWSVYRWIEGDPARPSVKDSGFAEQLGAFLLALHRIPADQGPAAGAHNFHRGGSLSFYDRQMRQAIAKLTSRAERRAVTTIWDTALMSRWIEAPVWVHGDVAAGNLLVRDGKLCAVIDFGQAGTGDPACDLTIAWTMFTGAARRTFRDIVALDSETWARARGWGAWKATILSVGSAIGPSPLIRNARTVLAAVLDNDLT